MTTYVYVKRNRKRPFSYPDKDASDTEFKLVSMGTAFNMVRSKQIGWERAKKGDYEHWLELTEESKNNE